MPGKYFSCPDGNTIEIKKCFKECRMEQRCLELPALMAVGKTRDWYGKPSVTQLLKPTLETYLSIKYDYTINPMNSIASLIGTKSHSLMEGNVPNGWLSEVRLEDDICSGQFDAYDCTTKTLVDYKFFGAFRIASALGYRGKWKHVGVYQRGINKGKDKFEMVYSPGGVKDILEIAIQLSYYRKLMMDHGLQVDKIIMQSFVRGGLDKTAKSYGLTQTAYRIPIFPLPIPHVRKYMEIKHNRLFDALGSDKLPNVCSDKERWHSNSRPDYKCHNYCNSNVNCPYYQEKYPNT